MTDADKMQFADAVIALLKDQALSDDMPVLVGTLSKPQGLKGFALAEIGHPVFEYKDRYLIYLESLDGKTTVTVPYYKETLRPAIQPLLNSMI